MSIRIYRNSIDSSRVPSGGRFRAGAGLVSKEMIYELAICQCCSLVVIVIHVAQSDSGKKHERSQEV